MDPMTLMAIMAAGQAVIGGIQSLSGDAKKREANRDFQKYKVPGGINSMLSVLQGMASQTEIPGADLARQRIASSTARGVETAKRTARSSTDVLGAMHRLYSNQMDKELDLAMAGAQNYQANRARLAQGLQTLGQYQSQKWQYNEFYPYMQKMTEAGQLSAAGGANIAGALKSGMSLAFADSQLNPDVEPIAKGESNKPTGSSLPLFSTETSTNQNPWMKTAWASTTPAIRDSTLAPAGQQTLSPVFSSYEDSNQYVPPSWRIPQIPPVWNTYENSNQYVPPSWR